MIANTALKGCGALCVYKLTYEPKKIVTGKYDRANELKTENKGKVVCVFVKYQPKPTQYSYQLYQSASAAPPLINPTLTLAFTVTPPLTHTCAYTYTRTHT